MQGSANLTVSIGADSSKLRSDLELAQKSLQGLRKELKAAADEAQRTGDRTGLDKLSKDVEAAEASVRSYNRQLRAARNAHDGITDGANAAGKSLSELNEHARRIGDGFGNLINNVFPRFKEVLALSVAAAAAAFVKLATDAAKATDELTDASDALGITSDKFQAMQLVAARAGAETDTVAAGLARFSKILGEAQSSATGTSDAFTKLGLNASQFPKTAEGNIRAYEAVAQKISAMGNSSEKAAIAAEFFGKGWVKQIEILKDFSKNLADAEKTIKDFGLEVSKSEQEQSEAYLKAYNTFKVVFERIKTILGNVLGTALVPFFEGLTKRLGESGTAMREWAAGAAQSVAPVLRDLSTLLTQGTGGTFETGGFKALTTAITGLGFAAKAAEIAVRGLAGALDLLLAPINAIFGTQFTGAGILLTAVIGKMVQSFLRWIGVIDLVAGAWGVLRTAVAWLIGGGFTAAVARVIPYVVAIGTAVRTVITAFAAIGAVVAGGAFWPVVVALALANLLIAVYAFRQQITEALGGALAWLQEKFSAFGTWLKETFGPIIGGVATAFQTAWNTVFTWFGTAWTAATEQFTKFSTWLKDTFGPIVGDAGKAFKDAWDAVFAWFGEKINNLLGLYDQMIAKLKEWVAWAKQAVGLGGGSKTAPAGAGARSMASGGYVSGPGSATSDSILARLSNGEFVMRAAAVRRWGPQVMAALNALRNPFGSFADGGMVRRMPRFADGGMVAAGPGNTVNLHLDGRAFAMRADNDTFESLMRTARSKQMLSAGRKPGWAGGRRYGG